MSRAHPGNMASRWRAPLSIALIGVSAACLAASSSALAVGYVAGMAALVGARIVRYRGQARRFVVTNNQGLAALARGDLDEAQQIFTRCAATAKLSRISALARHNLAWTLIRRGEHRGAIAVHTDNETRNVRSLRVIGLWPIGAIHRGLAHALVGDVDLAERWLDTAGKRVGPAPPQSFVAMRVLLRAVVLARRGDATAAAKLLDDEWARCENALTGEALRPLRVIRAYAIAATDVRAAGVASMDLGALKPRWPGELAFLGAHWPELDAFLASHALT